MFLILIVPEGKVLHSQTAWQTDILKNVLDGVFLTTFAFSVTSLLP